MKGIHEVLQQYQEERSKCQVWSRVMGYMRNVESFNIGKKSEFNERLFFRVKDMVENNKIYK